MHSLEEYYARDLGAYYKALTLGPSHNYFDGRAAADITGWVEYFCAGMADAFESVKRRAQEAARIGAPDQSGALRRLDPSQRRALELFRDSNVITSRDAEALFGISRRAARNLLAVWVNNGFVMITDAAKKTRKYGLQAEFRALLQ